jgi:hypothetical protein
MSHPSASNGRTRNPAEQNRADALALTLALTRSLRSLFRAAVSNRPSSSADERPSTRKGNVPEAPSLAPRRCARPPLGGRATNEWPQWRLFTSACTDEVASVGSVKVSTPCALPQGAPVRSGVRPHAN